MSEILFPPWLKIARAKFRYIDSSGASRSPYSGALKTASLGGDRIGCSLDMTPTARGSTAIERAALISFLMSMRGRQNRDWFSDPSNTIRGSFPSPELITNPTFANGTSGFTTFASTNAVTERVMRANSAGTSQTFGIKTSPDLTVTQYAPYVARAFIGDLRLNSKALTVQLYDGTNTYFSPTLTDSGLGIASGVVSATTAGIYAYDTGVGETVDSYLTVPYASLARCALVDNGPDLTLKSDQFDSTWTQTFCTVAANATAGPDGNTVMDALIEDGTTNSHALVQSATVSASAADFCATFQIKANNRTWALIQLDDTSNAVRFWINLSTGAAGSTTTGTNWSNARAFIVNKGNGIYAVWLIARKTGSATTLRAVIAASTGDTVISYAGTNALSAIYVWRGGLAPSGVPTNISQTTTAAFASGVTQSGSSLAIKGLPVSTSGLLLRGDWIQIGSQVNIVIAPLNSDAAGLGYLQCALPWRSAPADNDPVIINNPMGRFAFVGNVPEYSVDPGLFTNASFDFEEAA